MKNDFDVIVIGAGHAGTEAAFACANLGYKTLMCTLSADSVAETPCNPSIGGPAKGVVTREIDALGGMQGIATDANQLQMKLLNSSKGAGVWALRAQIDKISYHNWFINQIKKNKYLTLLETEVKELIIENKKVVGVKTTNKNFSCSKVIITSGTYMKAITHIGDIKQSEGPNHHKRSETLSTQLKDLGFTIIRLKTGTPPRIYKDSIDYDKMQIETGTKGKYCFSHFHPRYVSLNKQQDCFLTYTNTQTHKIIKENIHKSAMYSGQIHGVGPRYCPSIEDKIVRFADKPRHQVFIEPESMSLDTMYLQGLSTSLPKDVQEKFVHSIVGLKSAKFKKYAYAIEYDAIDARELWPSLESKLIKGLYFAGQVNGTSGYEEAACQGLMAGINAINSLRNKKPLILKRNEAYIGVLIDDIVTKGVNDPYRLLTSRAEHRLLLRNDNADDRLIKYGYKIGLVSKKHYNLYLTQDKLIKKTIGFLKSHKLSYINGLTKKFGNSSHNLYDLLKRPEVKLKQILKQNQLKNLTLNSIKKIEIKVKFEGYIKNQNKYIDRANQYELIDISKIKDFKTVKHLSLEAIDKLNRIRPLTLGQAQRISGINLTDLVAIKYYLDNE